MFNFKAILGFQVLPFMVFMAAANPMPVTNLLDALQKDLSLVFCTRLPYADGHWYANIGYYSTNENTKAYCGNGKPDKRPLRTYSKATRCDH